MVVTSLISPLSIDMGDWRSAATSAVAGCSIRSFAGVAGRPDWLRLEALRADKSG
jgi:hypothetical protein